MQPHRIGFLATGSELVSGEVINTNTPKMAAMLQAHGAKLGEHLVCDDTPAHLAQSLQFLSAHHQGILITGGLGPTSDDCTREVIAQHVGQDLIFSHAAWNAIVKRLQPRYLNIPETNRRQAYFPEKALLLENPNGTAWGFYLTTESHDFFVLPGPPHEALPLFETQVLSHLEALGYFSDHRILTWRVTGVSEALIAEQLDALGEPFGLTFGYRAHAPFIDIKLWISKTHPHLETIQTQVLAVIQDYRA